MTGAVCWVDVSKREMNKNQIINRVNMYWSMPGTVTFVQTETVPRRRTSLPSSVYTGRNIVQQPEERSPVQACRKT